MKIKKYAIFGNGGFAKEVYSLLCDIEKDVELKITYITNDDDYDPEIHGFPIIAIGNANIRKKIVKYLENKFTSIEFPNIIHKSAFIGPDVILGKGIIITQNCILTTNIIVGNFSHLNLATTIGHDVVLGEYFTTAPGVHVNGNVNVESCVYMGSNSSTIEKINICENVIVGAGAVITKSIDETGTYVGVPAKKINRR